MLKSTMADRPLTVRAILEHGARIHPRSEVVTSAGDAVVRRATYAEVAGRAARLANALRRLGIGPGDRVATFAWNNQEHLEAYLAVPSMGAVLHTLNIRLAAEQLAFIAKHAEDRIVIVDASLIPILATFIADVPGIEHVIVVGEGDAAPLGREVLRYEALLAAEEPRFDWPEIDERQAAAMCYTSGTTGDPKGVVYGHRSTWLHSMAVTSGAIFALSERDRVLPVVPMFHANAWGLPYAAWMVGAGLTFPDRFCQAAALAKFVDEARPTVGAAVPTVWNDMLGLAEAPDIGSLRLIVCGGSAVPRSLIDRFHERFGVRIVQAWGMTETSPLGSVALAPIDLSEDESMAYRATQGRPAPGVELRIVDDDGNELPWDGEHTGEIEVRGPWVTASYHTREGEADDGEKFHDGWLRTGDVGAVCDRGYIRISDRAKDVIKSGGEWISSVELENALMAHDGIREAAVIGVPDERWGERPLACVVRADGDAGAAATPEALGAWLAERVAKWQVPERWAFVDAVPRTSVGKFDKKVIRAQHAAGELDVVEVTR